VCYVDRLKGSMYLVNASQKCCKDLANTRLDLRIAANSLQIEGKRGCYLGTQPIGGVERRRTGPYIYILIIMHLYIYIYNMHMYIYIFI